LNVSLLAPTVFEGELREKVDTRDGFGTFQAMTLRFDGPLDLDNIVERLAAQTDRDETIVRRLVDAEVAAATVIAGDPAALTATCVREPDGVRILIRSPGKERSPATVLLPWR